MASYYSQSLRALPPSLSIKAKNEYATRLLEALEIQTRADGELYAREVKGLFGRLEGGFSEGNPVLESAVGMLLLHLRNCGYFPSMPTLTTIDLPRGQRK